MGRQKKNKKIQLLDLDVLGMILRGLKKYHKMHNYGLHKHAFPKTFCLGNFKNDDEWKPQSGICLLLPRSTAPSSSAHWQLQTSWDRPSPSPAIPVSLHNQAGCSSHLSFLSGGGTPPFSEGRAHPVHLGFIFT